jgi:sporulation protein YlmC with PRC-barrel domain/predicted small secreted protein
MIVVTAIGLILPLAIIAIVSSRIKQGAAVGPHEQSVRRFGNVTAGLSLRLRSSLGAAKGEPAMKRQRIVLLGSVALVATALAACEATDRTFGTNLSGSADTRAVPAGTVTSTQIPTEFRTMRVDQIVGKSVYNSAGDRVGEIDQVVVNRNSRATAAVVGVGGFLGIGEKKVVVPFDSMRVQGDRIVAPNLTKDRVSSMQTYEGDEWYRYERNRTLGELVR